MQLQSSTRDEPRRSSPTPNYLQPSPSRAAAPPPARWATSDAADNRGSLTSGSSRSRPAESPAARPASPGGRRVARLVQSLEVASPSGGRGRAPSPGPRASLEHATRSAVPSWSVTLFKAVPDLRTTGPPPQESRALSAPGKAGESVGRPGHVLGQRIGARRQKGCAACRLLLSSVTSAAGVLSRIGAGKVGRAGATSRRLVGTGCGPARNAGTPPGRRTLVRSVGHQRSWRAAPQMPSSPPDSLPAATHASCPLTLTRAGTAIHISTLQKCIHSNAKLTPVQLRTHCLAQVIPWKHAVLWCQMNALEVFELS